MPQAHRSYLEIPDEVLRAETPVEFRELLNRIRELAGLTNGQIAAKTKIPRSQAYSLTDTNRTTLPRKPEQVREFVGACKLSPIQVGLVMSIWEQIDNHVRDKAAIRTSDSVAHQNADSEILYLPPTSAGVESGQLRAPRMFLKAKRRERTFSDLCFLVLEDDERTQRAIRLLRPIVVAMTIAVVILIVALITWAILEPRSSFVAGIAIGLIMFMPSAMIRGFRRYRR